MKNYFVKILITISLILANILMPLSVAAVVPLSVGQGGTGNTTFSSGECLKGNGAGALTTAPCSTGSVTSVSGTTNRITSTGGATPVLDISTNYVGQNTITTLGTITTGIWNGTAITNANLANSTISGISLGSNLNSLTATNTTLTFSGSYNGSTARTVGLNLANANTWTGQQTFNTTAPIFGTITGSTQCLHVDTNGLISGTGADCGSGSGGVSTIASADGSITVSGTTAIDLAVVKSPKLTTARTIAITGDLAYTSGSFDGTGNVTGTGTLATVNSNVGTFGSATKSITTTVNGKGLITAMSEATITPAVGSITGLGTGVATFLATPSSANLISAVTDETGSGALVFGTTPTLTTPVINGTITGTGQDTAATASTIVMRDANANTSVNNLVSGFTTTATAAGTTTMTIASTGTQVWTGSSTQTVKLPTTSVLAGQQYQIINQSSGAVTVQSSGANTITILAANTSALFTAVVATPTTAANWSSIYSGQIITSGKSLSSTATLTLAGTDGSTLNVGTGGTLGTAAYTAASAYEVPLTFSTGLTRTTNTITVNTSQNIATLSNLTSNGLVTTSGAAGTLGITAMGSGIATFLGTPSSANLISAITDETGSGALVFGTTPTLATPVINGLATGTGVASGATASTLVSRDANANITANNWLGGYTTTATAAGTTTLTIGSTYLQFFTGVTTQTVTLPVVSTLALGTQYIIVNNSTGLVTVNSSGGNAVIILAGSTSAVLTSIATSGTGASVWSQSYAADNVTSGKKLSVSNTLTLAGTDSTTMTFPTTSATIARTDAANTFTGHQTIEGVTSTGATGTGLLVFGTSPTFITPALGTPSSATLTNATGLPEGGLSLTDITTNNASTSKHGFLLKLDNTASHYMDGTGAWSTPASSAFVVQDVDISVGNITTDAFYSTSNSDGSVMFIGEKHSASDSAMQIYRLAKDSTTGNFYVTHKTTLSTGNTEMYLAVVGTKLYVGASIGGVNALRQYVAADLSGVATMTFSGTSRRGNMFSDGTDLYIANGTTDQYDKFTISGTTATNANAAKTYTSSTAGIAISDGTSVWIGDNSIGGQNGGTLNVRKYAFAGGSASSTKTITMYSSARYDSQGSGIFIGSTSSTGLAFCFSSTTPTTTTGTTAHLFAISN